MTTLRFEAGARVLFIGDSNTDTAHRTYARPLGYGYVMMVHAFIAASRPELGIEVINRGNDGDTVLDLSARWQRDALALLPDWMFVMIGTNDVGNRYVEDRRHLAVDDATFQATMRELVERTREACNARIVLIEPPVFELPIDSAPNRDLEALCQIMERLAADHGCEYIPVRADMAAVLAAGHADGWFENVNHPAFPGHAFLAQRVLRHIGWQFRASSSEERNPLSRPDRERLT